VGAGLAIVAAVLLAFVPRLPTAGASHGMNLASGSVRVTSGTSRRQRVFVVTQIAACFVLLAGAGMLVKTLLSLQTVQTGIDIQRVLAINVPPMEYGKTPEQVVNFYKETIRRLTALPGVVQVAVGTAVPWRDAGILGQGFGFSAEGHVHGPGEEDPLAQFRTVSPGFFAALGVPLIAGRDFDARDRADGEQVVIVSQTLAQRMFPNQDAVNRHLMWTDPVMKFVGVSPKPRRIVGVVADLDDDHLMPGPVMNVYHPMDQEIGLLIGGRLFIHVRSNPYALVTPVTRIIREISADQIVERAATLEDVRAEVLTPDRLNAIVFGGFAGVALLIAVVGVAGVLAFSVSGRTREFGIRLAVGSEPRSLVMGVIREGALMAALGIVAGTVCGLALARIAGSYFEQVRMPGWLPVMASALVLLAAAVVASILPAARAARVDVIQALRAD